MHDYARAVLLPIVSLPTMLALTGCEQASAQPPYIGSIYSGSVKTETDSSDSPITRLNFGRATAEFKRTAPGKAVLTLAGTISDKGDAGFTVPGSYDTSGFHGSGPKIKLVIDPAGRISGGIVDKGSEYRFSGTITASEMALTVQYRPGAEAQPSIIRGITFTYTLENDAAGKSERAEKNPKGKDGRPCKRTRVENRAFPSFDGGPMTMGMVVVCAD